MKLDLLCHLPAVFAKRTRCRVDTPITDADWARVFSCRFSVGQERILREIRNRGNQMSVADLRAIDPELKHMSVKARVGDINRRINAVGLPLRLGTTSRSSNWSDATILRLWHTR